MPCPMVPGSGPVIGAVSASLRSCSPLGPHRRRLRCGDSATSLQVEGYAVEL